ncbi:MAG: hypothetical protein KC544_13765, partial [Gemmatimonadetes bacterium]|nr:hypothetical protein [Gemmatimonadota bacterium]
LVTSSGTGSGRVRWSRSAAGLPAGTYVDTIAITAPGVAPVRVVDTMVVTAAQPLAVSVTPMATHGDAQAGSVGSPDSVRIHLSGTGASSATWSATRQRAWTTLATTSGTGSAWLRWSRDATSLPVGTWVDTITVSVAGATGSPVRVIDTLHVTSDPVPLVLSASPGSQRVDVEAGAIAPATQVTIQITGTGAAGVAWSTTKQQGWTTLLEGAGVGSGVLRWVRSTAGLQPGIHVDTLRVTAAGVAGGPVLVLDTMVVLPPSTPGFAVTMLPPGRRTVSEPGFGTMSADAQVVITGTGSGSAIWTAEARGSWTTLLTPGGVGSGQLRWQRSLIGLNPGNYIDTLTITSGLVAVQFLDTLVIEAPGPGPAGIVLARRGARRVQLRMGSQQTDAASDSVNITALQGVAPGTAWQAWSSTPWITVSGGGTGAGTGTVRWVRSIAALGPGVHAGSVVIELVGEPGASITYADTLEVQEVPVPTPALAADALFGTGTLSSQQRAVFDAAGNRNGSFDLGDFLAWVDRNNIQLNAALLSRLAGDPPTRQAGPPAASGSP